MSKKSKRGASCAANGETAPSPLMRVVADLYQRIDHQKESIDGLREALGDMGAYADAVAAERPKLFAQIDRLIVDRDAALARVDMLARSGHSWASGCDRAETALARVQAAANRAFVIASTGVGSIHDIATILGEVVPEGVPLAEAWDGEVKRRFASWTAGRDDGIAVGNGLPRGFISIDAADLPARLVEKVAAQHAAGASFAEIDAADLPRDVFRRIFGLDRKPAPEPAKVPDCFGEGCTEECNRQGCARERAEARNATTVDCEGQCGAPDCEREGCAQERSFPEPEQPKPELRFTEAEFFMIEAAEQHGFHRVDDAGLYTASEAAIVALVKAAREQGERDLLKVVTPIATAAARAKVLLNSISHGTPTPETVGKTIKLIDDALDGLAS